MFLYDYLLACEISTVRTQTLKRKDLEENYLKPKHKELFNIVDYVFIY